MANKRGWKVSNKMRKYILYVQSVNDASRM